MAIFQTLKSVREEMVWVLSEEGGTHFTVDIFNWMDRDMKTGVITPYFDVEINLYNEQGVRVDNWVTDIETKKLDAVRRSREVLYLTKKWVANREQGLSPDIRLYYNREEVERHDKRKSNQRIETNPSRKRTNDQREKRVL